MTPRRQRSPRPRSWPPRTTSLEALLADGSDYQFRELVDNLVAFAGALQTVREALARGMGLSVPQYRIMMALAHHQGPAGSSVGELAQRLGVSIPLVVTESGRLVRRGYVTKEPNPADRRSVLVALTAAGRRALVGVAPLQRRLNDRLFGRLDARQFAALRAIAHDLVAGGAEATGALADDVATD